MSDNPFDAILSALDTPPGQQQELGGGLLQLLSEQGPEGSGLDSLVQQLKAGGLADKVGSWVSNGPNQPVTAQQLQQAIGPWIEKLAVRLGISPEVASQQLAKLLPLVIDKVCPDGKLPQSGLLAQGLNLLKGLLPADAGSR